MMQQMRAALRRYRELGATFWLARSEQEQQFLRIGGALLMLALVYSVLLEPALSGRVQLQKELPQLRQEAAEIDAMAQQAGAIAAQAPVPAPPMTRASLSSALAARSLTAQSIGVTADYAKVQLNDVSFAALESWLDALRHESRIAVDEASITARPGVGLVNASLTLHQSAGGAK